MSKGKLAKKLVKILGEAQKVNKSGMNEYAGYQYTTESDLLELLRPQLVEQGIFVFSSVESVTKEGDITTVTTSHTFVDSESGEEHTVKSAGQGADKQDKGIYKAITGATKYMLWKTFMVESNDDPEKDNANPGYTRGKTATKTKENTTATPRKSFGKAFSKELKPEPEAKVEPKTEIKAEIKTEVVEKKAVEPEAPAKRKSFGNRTFVTEKKEASF